MRFRAPRTVRGQQASRLAQRQLGAPVDPLRNRRADASGIARTAGRATLWACVGLLLARGVGDVLADTQPVTTTAPVRSRAASFPDGDALAFAAGFARSYLTADARHETRLASYFTNSSLSDQAAPSASSRGPGAAVAEATVAREVPLGGSRALITVAALLRDGRTRYLTVPVARDEHGGLAVYDLPSFSAPPVAGAVEAPAAIPLSGRDGEAVADLARRFLRVYLHGEDESALAYFLAPDAHVAPIGTGLAVEAIEEVARLGGAPGRGMQLAATVLVRDRASRITFRQRYRVAVERRERWYVTGLAGGPRS
jgi:hypothetical protein